MARRYDDRYGRGGYRRDRDRADDRGYFERAGDEVRSWLGDDEAQRRRYMDEQRDREQRDASYDRDRNDRSRPDWSRSDWNRSASARAEWQRSNWNPSNWDDRAREAWHRGPEDWRAGSYRETSRDYPRGAANEWRDRNVRWSSEYNRGDAYGPVSSFEARESRTYPATGWSVDDGRTEFGQQRWGRGPKGYQRSDTRILEDVCDRLTYSEVDAGDIEVHVSNGEVTLSGTVRDRWDKRRAEDIAEEVPGVRDVHNNIRVDRGDRGIGQSDTSTSDQPGTVLGVNPTASSTIANTERPKAKM